MKVLYGIIAVLLAHVSELAAEPTSATKRVCNRIVGNTCVITDNAGGRVAAFEAAAAEMRARGMRLVIAGRCDSACASVLVQNMRGAACATGRATFMTHSPMVTLERNHLDLPYWAGDERTFGAARAVRAGFIAPCPGHGNLRTARTGHPAPRVTARGTLVIAGCDPWGVRHHYRCGE